MEIQGVDATGEKMAVKIGMLLTKTDAPTEITTAGAVTYTAAQVLGGIIIRNTSGASRTDVLPTAALLVGAMQGESAGDTIEFMVINTATAAETITITAGSGGAFHASQTATSKIIGQDKTGWIRIRITSNVAGSEAYVVYM